MKTENEKTENAKKTEANVPVKTKIQREVIAWFWVGLVFLLINGTIGQARVTGMSLSPAAAFNGQKYGLATPGSLW